MRPSSSLVYVVLLKRKDENDWDYKVLGKMSFGVSNGAS